MVFVLWLSAVAPLGAGDANLDAARDGYNKTLARMKSLWTITRQDTTPLRKEAETYVDRRLEWGFDGTKHYSSWQAAVGSADYVKLPRVIRYSSDDKQYWSCFTSNYPPYELKAIYHGPVEKFEKPMFFQEEGVPLILGLGFLESGPGGVKSIHSLATLLNTSDATFLKFEEIGDAKCHKVRVGYLGWGPQDVKVEVTAWFDPAADWWPRKIVTNGYGTGTREVTHFQQVKLNTGPDTMAFPKSATFLAPGAFQNQYEVQEVRINQPIAPSVFTPKVPNGVELISMDDMPAILDFQRRHAMQSPQIQQEVAAATAAWAVPAKPIDIPAGLESQIDARPIAPFGASGWLIVCALVFLAAATFVALRARAA